MGDIATPDDDLLLKNFFAEVSEVERENEVRRSLSLSSSFHFFHLIIVLIFVVYFGSNFLQHMLLIMKVRVSLDFSLSGFLLVWLKYTHPGLFPSNGTR